MKVAILSESPGDEQILWTLTTALIQPQAELTVKPPIRSRGWPAVRNVLPIVIKDLHYHSDCDGLVVVVDSDGSPLHNSEHDADHPDFASCRTCLLRRHSDLGRSQRRTESSAPSRGHWSCGTGARGVASLLDGSDLHRTRLGREAAGPCFRSPGDPPTQGAALRHEPRDRQTHSRTGSAASRKAGPGPQRPRARLP